MLILGVFMMGVPAKPDQSLDDAALVRKAKEGDVNAFEILIKRHQRSIYALCRRLTGSHQSADDIAQETFIKAYFSLARFDDKRPLYPWLRRIAVNSALNLIKSRRRESPIDEAKLEYLARPHSGPGPSVHPDSSASVSEVPLHHRPPSPEERFEKKERERKFQQALASLPPDQRSVFVLRFYENLSYEEIARALRLPAGTVMSRLNRARSKLKLLLADSFLKENLR